MLDSKLDNIIKVILGNHDSTINQAVTLELMCMTECGEWKCSEISRNYLITGWGANIEGIGLFKILHHFHRDTVVNVIEWNLNRNRSKKTNAVSQRSHC